MDDELADYYETLFDDYRDVAEIVKFKDGDAAWQELSQRDPDLFITDFVHPGVDGLELLKRLAGNPAEYPILFITGFQVQELCEEFCQTWCPQLKITFLEKPFGTREFYKHLANAVASRFGRNRDRAGGPMPDRQAASPRDGARAQAAELAGPAPSGPSERAEAPS